MKYVMFEQTHSEHGLYMPVLFPDHISHSQVKVESCKPVSAGFYDEKKQFAYGKSDSLKLKANAIRDSALLNLIKGNWGTAAYMKSSYSPISDFIERRENKHGKDE